MRIYELRYETEKGRKIVTVPLENNDATVTLWDKDYQELEAMGAGLPWLYVQGTVGARVGKSYRNRAQYRLVSIPRLILDSDKGEQVRFIDGDSCNLRRSNLIRTYGPSQYKARDMIDQKHKRPPPATNHLHYN